MATKLARRATPGEATLRHRLHRLLRTAKTTLAAYSPLDAGCDVGPRMASAREQLDLLAEILGEIAQALDAMRDLADLSRQGALVVGAADAGLAIVELARAQLEAQLASLSA